VVMEKHQALLEQRYDLADHPVSGVTMSRGKPVQGGVRVELPECVSREQLAAMKPGEIREKGLYPKGLPPLPHPNHPEGGMVFPKYHITEFEQWAAYFDGDLMHNMKAERFFAPQMINGRYASPYLHDGRLLTLEDTMEWHNLLLSTKLTEKEKTALVVFLRCL
jgi:hypothetical protein